MSLQCGIPLRKDLLCAAERSHRHYPRPWPFPMKSGHHRMNKIALKRNLDYSHRNLQSKDRDCSNQKKPRSKVLKITQKSYHYLRRILPISRHFESYLTRTETANGIFRWVNDNARHRWKRTRCRRRRSGSSAVDGNFWGCISIEMLPEGLPS